jgi:hypothetical protein
VRTVVQPREATPPLRCSHKPRPTSTQT